MNADSALERQPRESRQVTRGGAIRVAGLMLLAACSGNEVDHTTPSARPSQAVSSAPSSTRTTAVVAPSPTSGEDAASANAPAGACQAGALQKELEGYCALGEQTAPPNVAVLPWATAPGTRPADSLEIVVGSNGEVRLNGSPVALDHLGDALRRRAGSLAPQKRPSWTLAIHPNAMATDVARVMRTLAREGAPSGHLAFRVRDEALTIRPRDPKRLATLHAKMARSTTAEKAMILADTIQASPIARCAALVKTFSAVAGVARENKCRILAAGIAEGLPKCQCRDADEILTLMYAVMVDTAPTQQRGAWVDVTWSETAPVVVAGVGAPWSGFVSQLDHARLRDLRMTDG